MAIRYRENRRSPWEVYWINPATGKRQAKSFGSLKAAEECDSLTKHRLKFDRDSFEAPAYKPKTFGATLEEVVLCYFQKRHFDQKQLSSSFKFLKNFLDAWGETPIKCISATMLAEKKDELLDSDLKPVTVRDRLRRLKTVFTFAVQEGMLDAMPKWPETIRATYEQLQPPTVDEIKAICDAGDDVIRRVVILGSQIGVRVGECELFQLTWVDVNFTSAVIRIHGSKKNESAQWREVPLRDELVAAMRVWKEEDDKTGIPWIIHKQDGKKMRSLQVPWQKALQAAGITRRIRPYDLRHAFATEAIAAGADIGTVAALMGHSNATMILKHYQYVTSAHKRAALQSMPSIPL